MLNQACVPSALELSASEPAVHDPLAKAEISIADVIHGSGLPSSAVSVALLGLDINRQGKNSRRRWRWPSGSARQPIPPELAMALQFRSFAIPHCQNDAGRFNSLVMLKPKTPPAWSSLPVQPVRVVILLAIRATRGGNARMQVLAKLARKIMREDFCAQITTETDPAPLRALLQNVF